MEAKYVNLVESFKETAWKAIMWPVEVGCRGFNGF